MAVNLLSNQTFNETPDGIISVFTLVNNTQIEQIISIIMNGGVELYETSDFTISDSANGEITFVNIPEIGDTFAVDLLTTDNVGVTVPITCEGFVRLTEAKAYLGITDSTYDVQLLQYVCITRKYIERYVNRNILQVTISNEVVRTDGYANEYILEQSPVSETESLTVTNDGTELTIEDDYEIDYGLANLYFGRPPAKSFNKLKVTYTAGYPIDGVPEDLKGVSLAGIAYMFDTNKARTASGGLANGSLKSKKIDDFSVSYDKSPALQIFSLETPSGVVAAYPWIIDNKDILDRYKKNPIWSRHFTTDQ